MRPRRSPFACCLLLLASAAVQGQDTFPADLSGVTDGPIKARVEQGSLLVEWQDERSADWRAVFSLDPDEALVQRIESQGNVVLREARPLYRAETGVRRKGWNAFFDYPPAHPDGTRSWQGVFQPRKARVRTAAGRVEACFEGLRLGLFEGEVCYTFFPGSRLIQQEAVATTYKPNVAYLYDAGLQFAAPRDERPGRNMKTRFVSYDTEGKLVESWENGFQPERIPVKVRYRALAVETEGGGVTAFPPPHQYFAPRDFTSNLGFVWRRSRRGQVSLGIRQIPDTNWQFYPWMNAPPGRPQRMSMFLLLSADGAEESLEKTLAYTNRDRYQPLDGYKTLSSHWHLAYTVQAMDKGFDWTPPFKPVLEEMGVDASIIMDFHGDGHPRDLTELRLKELDAFFRACRSQSDENFLLIPSEEANVHLGGHWAVVFPKPVYWFLGRPEGMSFVSEREPYGKVYAAGDAKEMLDLVQTEDGFMYQTHARTKGSTGYPDKIRDTEHFRDSSYLGAGWKAMPSDPSSPRLGDRVFTLLDDMNNWGLQKKTLAEVDVFQFDHTHELYAHMNVNYVRADSLPDFEHYHEILEPVTRGDFFVTTGEVLLPEVKIEPGEDDEIRVQAQARWTFPLRFAEIVWGDGERTQREIIPLEKTGEHAEQTFEWSVQAPGWRWARVAVWDVAANGAFVNPVYRER